MLLPLLIRSQNHIVFFGYKHCPPFPSMWIASKISHLLCIYMIPNYLHNNSSITTVATNIQQTYLYMLMSIHILYYNQQKTKTYWKLHVEMHVYICIVHKYNVCYASSIYHLSIYVCMCGKRIVSIDAA